MSAKTQLYRQYRTAIDLWPIDPLRPQLSFQTFLQERIAKQFGIAEEDIKTSTKDNSAALATGGGEKQPVVIFNETKVSSELNALQTLLEDRYRKKYPIRERLLRPKGNPEYYENLMKELEQAPERSWFQRQLNSWKGYIRMK